MNRAETERILLVQAISERRLDLLRNENITPEFFDTHKKIALDLWENYDKMKGKTISLVSAENKATDQEDKKHEIYQTIKDWTPRPDDVEEAVEELREYHAHDEVNRTLLDIKNMVNSDRKHGWKKIIKAVPTRLAEIENIMVSSKPVDFAVDAEQRLDYIRERARQRESGNWRVQFAHPDMNKFLGGYEPGFYMYVARTGVGKTWSCLLDAWHSWYYAEEPLNVGIFSLEMNVNRIGLRLDTFGSHFRAFELQKGRIVKDPTIMDPREIEKQANEYRNYLEEIRDDSISGKRGKFRIWTLPSMGGKATPNKIEALVRSEKLDFVVVDQLELVDADEGTMDDKDKLNRTSLAFKKMAENLEIPVLVPHQMNRETLKVKEVTAANVAGSDGPARHAEFVCHLTRDEHSKVMWYSFLKMRDAPSNEQFALQWDYSDGYYSPVGVDNSEYQRSLEQDQAEEDMEATDDASEGWA